MRQRNSRVGGRPEGCGDAGHHGEIDLCRRERLQLLAAAPEDEGIAALEPHHAPALFRMLDQQGVDFLLRAADRARRLAHADSLRIAPCEIEHRGGHQSIVQDYIGILQRAQRLERQEFRIAGPGAHQSHLSGCARRGRARRQQLLCDAPARLERRLR